MAFPDVSSFGYKLELARKSVLGRNRLIIILFCLFLLAIIVYFSFDFSDRELSSSEKLQKHIWMNDLPKLKRESLDLVSVMHDIDVSVSHVVDFLAFYRLLRDDTDSCKHVRHHNPLFQLNVILIVEVFGMEGDLLYECLEQAPEVLAVSDLDGALPASVVDAEEIFKLGLRYVGSANINTYYLGNNMIVSSLKRIMHKHPDKSTILSRVVLYDNDIFHRVDLLSELFLVFHSVGANLQLVIPYSNPQKAALKTIESKKNFAQVPLVTPKANSIILAAKAVETNLSYLKAQLKSIPKEDYVIVPMDDFKAQTYDWIEILDEKLGINSESVKKTQAKAYDIVTRNLVHDEWESRLSLSEKFYLTDYFGQYRLGLWSFFWANRSIPQLWKELKIIEGPGAGTVLWIKKGDKYGGPDFHY